MILLGTVFLVKFPPFNAFSKYETAPLTPSVTALEVMVAPEIASICGRRRRFHLTFQFLARYLNHADAHVQKIKKITA